MGGVGSLCCSQGDAVEVAGVTEQVLFERIAPLVWFVGELHAAVLHRTITIRSCDFIFQTCNATLTNRAVVTINVEIFIHRNYTNRFLSSLKKETRYNQALTSDKINDFA